MEKASRLLQQLAADQQRYADLLAEQIEQLDGVVEGGGFPSRFTSLHDLSFEYLLDQVLQYHRNDVAEAQRLVERLDPACPARSLVEQIAQMLGSYLEQLESLLASAGATGRSSDAAAEDTPSQNEPAHASPATG